MNQVSFSLQPTLRISVHGVTTGTVYLVSNPRLRRSHFAATSHTSFEQYTVVAVFRQSADKRTDETPASRGCDTVHLKMAETAVLQVQGMTCGGELSSIAATRPAQMWALLTCHSPPSRLAACVKAIEDGLAGQVGIQTVSVALLYVPALILSPSQAKVMC